MTIEMTAAPTEPPSNESYIEAAMKAVENAPSEEAEAVEPAPEAKVEAKPAETKVEPKAGEKAPLKSEVKADEEAAPSDSIRKSFEKLASSSAELRAEKERLKPYLELADKLDPNSLSAVARAVKSGDPVSALAALGFSHADYAESVANGRQPLRREQTQESQQEQSPAEARIARLEAQLSAMTVEKGRNEALGSIAKMADKFELVSKFGSEAHSKALNIVEDYYVKHGVLPAETKDESYKMALELVESDLKKEADRWKRVLTIPETSNKSTTTEAAVQSPPAGSSQRSTKTLTSSASTAPTVAAAPEAEPKTAEDYQRLAARELEKLLR